MFSYVALFKAIMSEFLYYEFVTFLSLFCAARREYVNVTGSLE